VTFHPHEGLQFIWSIFTPSLRGQCQVEWNRNQSCAVYRYRPYTSVFRWRYYIQHRIFFAETIGVARIFAAGGGHSIVASNTDLFQSLSYSLCKIPAITPQMSVRALREGVHSLPRGALNDLRRRNNRRDRGD